MKCPIDSVDLVITERSGVEIDYCPQCRGVWLDRGELDKIIERSADFAGPAVGASRGAQYAPPPYDRGDARDDRRYGHGGHDRQNDRGGHGKHGGRRRREGFLGDLFDF